MKHIRVFSMIMVCTSLVFFAGCSNKAEVPPTAIPTSPMPTREVATLVVEDETPKCNNVFFYVGDVNYSDGTVVAPGTVFRKEWEVENRGNCRWDEGYKLRFISGDQMNADDVIMVPMIPVGANGKLAVEFTAPTEPGTYRSEWKMFGSDNRSFGDTLYVEIVVQ